MDKSEVKNFPHSEGRGGGGSSSTKTKVRFKDAWNISAWSYVMCRNMSRVSHQKAERGGGFSADLLTLRFCQLNTVVFRNIRKTNDTPYIATSLSHCGNRELPFWVHQRKLIIQFTFHPLVFLFFSFSVNSMYPFYANTILKPTLLLLLKYYGSFTIHGNSRPIKI